MSKEIEIRRLNEKGVEKMKKFWDNPPLTPNRTDILKQIENMLENDEYTEKIKFSDGKVRKIKREFSPESNMEYVLQLDKIIGDIEYEELVSLELKHMWTWLSLLCFDTLMPRIDDLTYGNTKKKDKSMNHMSKFIPNDEMGRVWYKLFTSVRYLSWVNCGKDSSWINNQNKPHIWSDVHEQLLSVSAIHTNPVLIKVVNELYYSSKNKTGYHKGAGGKNGGTARRFREVISQLGFTYQFSLMSSKDIIDLLPKEFDRFKEMSRLERQEVNK